MKHLLCSVLLLVAALQAFAGSPETKKNLKEAKTEFATFKLPEEWMVPPSNVHFGLPEYFEANTADGKKFKIYSKAMLYMPKDDVSFNNDLTVSHHRAEKGYKATISDVKRDFDNQISYRSSGKAHIIWMSVGKDTSKGIASVLEKVGINGRWVSTVYKYIIYVKQIESDVFVVEARYKKDESKLTDDEYNRLAKDVIDSLKPIN